MADDAARIAQLEAELRRHRADLREACAAIEQRDRALAEAAQQQAAITEILRTIVASGGDAPAILDAIAEHTARIAHATGTLIYRRDGDVVSLVAHHGIGHVPVAQSLDVPLRERRVVTEAIRERRPVHVPDLAAVAADRFPETWALRRTSGAPVHNTWLGVPLLVGTEAIGGLVIQRAQVSPFTDHEIVVVEAFAAEAALAIENARLFEQLEQRNAELQESNRLVTEALEQQTALGDVLRVIATSPTDVQPVLDAVAERAARLCDTYYASVVRVDGDVHRIAARFILPSVEGGEALTPAFNADTGVTGIPMADSFAGRAMTERRTVQIPDIKALSDEEYPTLRDSTLGQSTTRTFLATPLLREGTPIGAIILRRQEVRPFTEQQIRLLEAFADQAVIAIENARLFEELERRNTALQESNRQVTESLEQQTATAEVLRVIAASPNDLDRVLTAVAESAARLCEAEHAAVQVPDGGMLRVVANVFATDEAARHWADRRARRRTDGLPPLRITLVPERIAGRAALERRTVYVADLANTTEFPASREVFEAIGVQSQVTAPLIRGGELVGVFTLHALRTHAFSPSQVAQLETFADQAVIAIENARLFEELERRNRELSVSLEQQTAMSNILGVIASSPASLQAVLDQVAESAARLCDAAYSTIYRESDNALVPAASYGTDASIGLPISRGWVTGRAFMDRRTVHVTDLAAVADEFPDVQPLRRAIGQRAVLSTPLLRQGAPIGAINVARMETRSFTESQVKLIETFADQAVIAIENARLFEALQDANQQLAEASRHKSQFLANMSHELRTPLNAIIGYSEMLQEEAEDLGEETFLPDLQRINAAGKHLLGLINDILDLSKIEAGRMDLFLETFSIAVMIEDVEAVARPLVEKNGNTLVVSCPDDLATMHADQTKVRQALFNLMSNAAKFTESGTISLTVERDRDDWITFAVTDTGIGMTEEQLGRLFEAFSQAEASTRSQYGGTGLGLAISRHFCRLMRGDLTVSSVYGEGSTFTVRLPTTVAEPVHISG